MSEKGVNTLRRVVFGHTFTRVSRQQHMRRLSTLGRLSGLHSRTQGLRMGAMFRIGKSIVLRSQVLISTYTLAYQMCMPNVKNRFSRQVLQ